MSLDFSDDYLLFDNPECVVLDRVAEVDRVQVSHAIRSPITKREMEASNGAYLSCDVTWLIPGKLVDRVPPTPGDVIEDDEEIDWTILDFSADNLTGDYLCVCRDLVLVHGLTTPVTIYRPTNTQDDQGNRNPSYAAVSQYTNLPAKVQEQDGERQEAFGKQGFRRRYSVYLGSRVVVTTEDQVRVGSTVYQIVSYRNPDRIGELMQLEVEVLP